MTSGQSKLAGMTAQKNNRGSQLPKAIIFDLDDTILDDSGAVDLCWGEVCERASGRLNGMSAADLLAAIERRRDWFWSTPERHREGRLDLRAATHRIVSDAIVELGFDLPELAREIAEGYRDLREERICVFPGAIATLERARQLDIRLGMITNGSAAGQRSKLDRFDLARHFTHVLVEGEFGAGKPDPRVYHTTLAALDVSASDVWIVGDNLEWDVGTPQKLGIYGVWVDPHARGLPEGSGVVPDRTIRSIAELLEEV